MNTADAIRSTLISPNVPDSNMEPANVVDVIAGGGINIKKGITNHGEMMLQSAKTVQQGLLEIASALHRVADAINAKSFK